MGNRVGADLATLEKLAKKLQKAGTDVETLKGEVDEALKSVDWVGGRADKTKGELEDVLKAAGKFQITLDDASKFIDTEKERIDLVTNG